MRRSFYFCRSRIYGFGYDAIFAVLRSWSEFGIAAQTI